MKAAAERTEVYADPHDPPEGQGRAAQVARVARRAEPQNPPAQASAGTVLEFPAKSAKEKPRRSSVRDILARWLHPTGFLGI